MLSIYKYLLNLNVDYDNYFDYSLNLDMILNQNYIGQLIFKIRKFIINKHECKIFLFGLTCLLSYFMIRILEQNLK